MKKKEKLAFLMVLAIAGIILRFYYQFLEWSFNGDEVDLGWGIIHTNFEDLFYPLPNRQSAPPFFLTIEKLLAPIAKPYISFKILSFTSSCISIFLFLTIIKNQFSFNIQIVLLALFCFNPFIIENSLTLKQYTLDLMLGLFATNLFINNKSNFQIFSFFSVFCLISNIGLFFCVSMVIFIIFDFAFYEKKKLISIKVLKRILPFALAPVPYLIYFFWFMNQPGAVNMKKYMVDYWSGAFMPTDISVIKWMGIQAKVLSIFFFSTYVLVGLIILFFIIISFFLLIKKRNKIFKNRLFNIILIYIITAIVHLFISSLKLYPFSDRFFLYLAPGIYLLLGYGFTELNEIFKKQWYYRLIYNSFFLIIVVAVGLYFTYMPVKRNDVAGLMKFVNSTDQKIELTSKAKKISLKWLEFTKYDEINEDKLLNAAKYDLNSSESSLLVSVQSLKFGHKRKLSNPEPIIKKLLNEKKIELFKNINGYAIYKFNN